MNIYEKVAKNVDWISGRTALEVKIFLKNMNKATAQVSNNYLEKKKKVGFNLLAVTFMV